MVENSSTHYITLFVFLISLICVVVLLVAGLMATLSKRGNKKSTEDASEPEIDQIAQHADKPIIECFRSLDNRKSIVKLEDGKSFVVWNIVYGYDMGEDFAYITTNINPTIAGTSIDGFCTNEIAEIINPENQEVIFKK
jgi:hypothetical protein